MVNDSARPAHVDVAAAFERLEAAVSRLEESAVAMARRNAAGSAQTLDAARAELAALRDLHQSVSGTLDTAIARLRSLVGEE